MVLSETNVGGAVRTARLKNKQASAALNQLMAYEQKRLEGAETV